MEAQYESSEYKLLILNNACYGYYLRYNSVTDVSLDSIKYLPVLVINKIHKLLK